MPRGFEEGDGVAYVSGVAFLEVTVPEVNNGVGAPVMLSQRWWRCSEAVHLGLGIAVVEVVHDSACCVSHLEVFGFRIKDPVGRWRGSFGQ